MKIWEIADDDENFVAALTVEEDGRIRLRDGSYVTLEEAQKLFPTNADYIRYAVEVYTAPKGKPS